MGIFGIMRSTGIYWKHWRTGDRGIVYDITSPLNKIDTETNKNRSIQSRAKT
jgi:hypothetical protein